MSKFNYIYSDPTINASGSTPYGIYDEDNTFQADSLTVTKWTARRLGHPVLQLEIYSGSIYACFEEAISEYSTHINNYNMKNWMWEHYGTSNKLSGSVLGSTGSNEPVSSNLGTAVHMSDTYGTFAGVGGDVHLKSGSVSMVKNKQEYDLQTWAEASESGNRLVVQAVFNQGPSAITRFYDPFAGSFEQRNMLDAFGMGNTAPAVSYIMRPISYDISRAQAIETNDLIRKSAYSFHIADNKLKIFPRPTSTNRNDKIWFHYYVRNDLTSTTNTTTQGRVSDPSNAPYKFLPYQEINSTGRQWIRKYTLALSKELLGIIRSKYASLPLPGGEVSMDGESLKAEGREEKDSLLEELKGFLDSISLSERATAEAEIATSNQQVLSRAPLTIFIG
tara:strand:- start:538 stop:1710 length:1173 start_codon:yes stop_codon:yes gene_type:complete